MTKTFSPAAERNAGAILDVLRVELRGCESVLEIGSGTGQHAVLLGQRLPELRWQPSDVAANCDGIRERVAEAALPNVAEPFVVDVLDPPRIERRFDSVFSSNTAHIMSPGAVSAMFALVAALLPPGGLLVLYGPLRQGGRYNTESNAVFDRSLQKRDPQMGIRDIELLDDLAREGAMQRARLYAMPANNHTAVWKKSGGLQ